MNIPDACRELGLEGGATKEVVRRAYLRLLKTRKPEIDPEGFQRLREAYELLALGAGGPGSPRAVGQAPAPRVIIAPQVGGGLPRLIVPSATDAAPRPKVAAEVTKPLRLIACGNGAEAARPAPKKVAPPPAVAETNRDAEPPPLAPLVHPLPPHRSPADLAAQLERGDVEGAARGMTELFELAATHFGVRVATVASALDLELLLLASGDGAAARRLHEAFAPWLLATGSEATLIRDRAAARLALLRELFALPGGFDGRVLRNIALAVRAGSFAGARAPLVAFRDANPSAAREHAALLARHAPMIASALKGTLEAPAATEPAAPAPVARKEPWHANLLPLRKPHSTNALILSSLLVAFTAFNLGRTQRPTSFSPAPHADLVFASPSAYVQHQVPVSLPSSAPVPSSLPPAPVRLVAVPPLTRPTPSYSVGRVGPESVVGAGWPSPNGSPAVPPSDLGASPWPGTSPLLRGGVMNPADPRGGPGTDPWGAPVQPSYGSGIPR